MQIVELAISKSLGAPLTVILEYNSRTPPQGAGIFMQEIVRHSRRWRKATFHTRYPQIVSSYLADIDAPNLEALIFQYECSFQGAATIVNLTTSSELRHLGLRNTFFTAPATTMSTIQSLHICDLYYEPNPSVEALFSLLGCCPQLQDLRLESIHLRGLTSLTPYAPFSLQRLRLLHINCIQSEILESLVSALPKGDLTGLKISCADNFDCCDLLHALQKCTLPSSNRPRSAADDNSTLR